MICKVKQVLTIFIILLLYGNNLFTEIQWFEIPDKFDQKQSFSVSVFQEMDYEMYWPGENKAFPGLIVKGKPLLLKQHLLKETTQPTIGNERFPKVALNVWFELAKQNKLKVFNRHPTKTMVVICVLVVISILAIYFLSKKQGLIVCVVSILLLVFLPKHTEKYYTKVNNKLYLIKISESIKEPWVQFDDKSKVTLVELKQMPASHDLVKISEDEFKGLPINFENSGMYEGFFSTSYFLSCHLEK
jgi:hypothetical protein